MKVTMLDKYSTAINNIKSTWGAPSLSIGVFFNNQISGFSTGELAVGKTNINTVYRIASLTKAFTAIALGLMVDDGLLKWDDPVIKYLPEFKVDNLELTKTIKVEDLLSHCTGVDGSLTTVLACLGYSTNQIIEKMKYLKITAKYKEKFQYNNSMYLIAGQLFKTIMGGSWEQVLKQKIFAPLNMKNSSTTYQAFNSIKNKAFSSEYFVNFVDNIAPGGSINSSVSDMLSWINLI